MRKQNFIMTMAGQCIFIVLICIQGTVLAGGLWIYETGTSDTGLANAGLAARAQDASTAYNNPAGMSLLEQSQWIFGLQALYGDLEFSSNGQTSPGLTGGDGGNAIGWMPGASFAYVHRLNEEWSFGVSNFSNFGLGLDYDNSWAGRYYVQDATLIGLSVMPSLSYRINEQWSVGAGLNAMYGMMETKLAINNAVGSDGRMKYKDNQWGFGGVAGIIYELNKKTRFGLTYTSPVDLDFEDNPDFSNLGPGFDWLLNRADIRKLDLGLTVPQTLMGSFYHELDEKWALLGNLGWQDWSEFGRVDVSIDANNSSDITKDLDYKDTWSIGLGTQYKFAPKWTASTGISYDSAMLDDGDATPAMPVGDTWKWGIGLQHEYSKSTTIGIHYEMNYAGDIKVDQERGPLSGRLAGDYDNVMIHIFGASITHRF